MTDLGGEVRERLEDEGSFMEPWVRDLQVGLRDAELAVKEQIEVQRARRVAFAPATPPRLARRNPLLYNDLQLFYFIVKLGVDYVDIYSIMKCSWSRHTGDRPPCSKFA